MKRLLSLSIMFFLVGCSFTKEIKDPPPDIEPITLHTIVKKYQSEFDAVSVLEVSYYFKGSTYIYEIYGQNESESIHAKYMAEDGRRFSLDVSESMNYQQEVIQEDLDTLLILVDRAINDMGEKGLFDSWYLYKNKSQLQLDVYFVDENQEALVYNYDVKAQKLLHKGSPEE